LKEKDMSKGNAFGILVVVVAGALSPAAFAQGAKCNPVVTQTAEVEQTETDAQGKKTTKLVALATAVPGTEVIYTTTVTNNCKAPADKISIDGHVPEHMSYVSGSSFSPGAQVQYSIDGKTFGAPEQLSVSENGAPRRARAQDYRHFRWTFQSSLPPGGSVIARFRAVVN
jgi:uncharacterized repeat protein (TIGR01451 family)